MSFVFLIIVLTNLNLAIAATESGSPASLPDIHSPTTQKAIDMKEHADTKRLEERFAQVFHELRANHPTFSRWIRINHVRQYLPSIRPSWVGIIDQFDECKHLFVGWEELLFMALCFQPNVLERVDMVNALQKFVANVGILNDNQKAQIPYLYDLPTHRARDVSYMATVLEMQKKKYDRLVKNLVAEMCTSRTQQASAALANTVTAPARQNVALANALPDEQARD